MPAVVLEQQRETQGRSTTFADQQLTIDLEQSPELDQLINVNNG